MPDIVIAEFMGEAAVEELRRDFEVLYDPELVGRPAELLEAVGTARALIVRNRTQVRGALLDAAPRLEVVGRLGVGLDNIDLEACRARDIEVCPATGANDQAVAEYVIAAILVLLRGAYHANGAMLAGVWPRGRLMGREAAGKRLGLVGFGRIARAVAARARALGMSLHAYDPYLCLDDPAWDGVTPHDLPQLLATSHVVSLHVPLGPATRHVVDAAALARMRPDAILINAARGGVVDEEALAQALRAGRLGGAALDVFEEEPLGANAAARFEGVANLILTPHIAGVSTESNERVSAVTAANVRRVLGAGRPRGGTTSRGA